MHHFHWDHRPRDLKAPALVMAFRGWNDAGEAASTALTFLRGCGEAERFAYFEAEEFFDYQQTRPRIKVAGGATRRLDWPRIDLHALRAASGRDLVLLSGPEPSLRWKTFSNQLVELAENLGVQLVLSLGSLLAEVPHSRPVPLSLITSERALSDRLAVPPTDYEGPTGIVGVLHNAFLRAGFPTVSLWASVPHYVAAAPNPKAALALVRRAEALLGVTVDASALERASCEYERQIDRAVRSDPEVRAFVERLEDQAASEEPLAGEQIPSGEILAREFQRFLRQRSEGQQ